MEDRFKFSHTIYEVVSEQTQKYASTTVSDGQLGRHTLVTHHSDQGLWLKDVISGKERKFEFHTFNVDAREGHKLAVVWRDPSGEMEAVKNINTDDLKLGITDFDKNNLVTCSGTIMMAIIFGMVFLIPFFAAGLYLMMFLVRQTPVGQLKTKNIPRYRRGLLFGAIFYFLLHVMLLNYELIGTHILQYIMVLFVVNSVVVIVMNTVASNYVKAGRKALSDYVAKIN